MDGTVTFAAPYLLWLLLLVPVAVYYQYFRKAEIRHVLRFSSLAGIRPVTSYRIVIMKALPALRIGALALLVVALARPQSSYGIETVTSEGIDIVLATDLSGSMLAEDFVPNRMEAAKAVAAEFIDHRPGDRIGIVIFAGESFTLSPLTTDHTLLKNALSGVSSGMLKDGTAIGMGLATAVDRLRGSQSKSKVIILLTDGVNNSGFVAPVTAAEIAQKYGIRVYTIGMGSDMQNVPLPGFGSIATADIDEGLLRKIASMTGGEYFRATDNGKLRQIYFHIDQLEKSKIESSRYQKKKEAFMPWVLGALGLLAVEFLGRYTLGKSIT